MKLLLLNSYQKFILILRLVSTILYFLMKVAFYTLGCKLNYAETSALHRVAVEQGYEVVPFSTPADVYVINTCTVTNAADKKCRNIIRKAIRQKEGSKVIVTGCYAELNSTEISGIEGVNLIIGNSEKSKFANDLKCINNKFQTVQGCNKIFNNQEFFAAYSIGDRTRSFLKVQDGCNYYCSYCTIPYARGRSRNAPVTDLIKDAKLIASKGIREIVLTGVNIGDFGHSTGETFFELINAMDKVDGIDRFRISSIEPDLLTNEIIEFVSSAKRFVHHFHIPLQSGSDTVLQLMKRKYDTELFRNKIKTILKIMPDACIGVDVIVGFPQEKESEFDETCKLLKSLDIAYLHVFSYSERENTLSAKMQGKVSEIEKEKRSRLLHSLSTEKKETFYKKFINKEMKVLFERKNKNGNMYGFTTNYIKVETVAQKELFNKITNVKLLGIDKEKMVMFGKLIL